MPNTVMSASLAPAGWFLLGFFAFLVIIGLVNYFVMDRKGPGDTIEHLDDVNEPPRRNT